MNIPGLLFLILAQFLAGRGILGILNVKQKPLQLFIISELMGLVVISLIPMFVEMLRLPITHTNIFVAICLVCITLFVVPIKRYQFGILKPSNIKIPSVKIYEWLFLGLFTALMIPSLWRCFYYPVNARDVLSGPEAIAEYAVKEQAINNSVFTTNMLESIPNLLKPPFVTDLQIVYKLFVHPFGQIWLSIFVICFMVWLYTLLREKLHPVVAGFVFLQFLVIPEVYGYTYIVLWDYCNMIFFFGGFYFLHRFFETKHYNLFLLSCIMFGLATYIRLETLVFIALIGIMLAYYQWRDKVAISRIVLNLALFGGIPFFFYFIWVNVFVKYYLPLDLSLGSELTLTPETSYIEWFNRINSELIFGGINIGLYGLFIYFFIAVVLIDAIIFRSFSKEARLMLLGVAIVYFGMPLLTYFTQWFNITTAKRGIFKAFPIMILYMRYSATFTKLSDTIFNYELTTVVQNKTARQPVAQPVALGKKKGKKNKK